MSTYFQNDRIATQLRDVEMNSNMMGNKYDEVSKPIHHIYQKGMGITMFDRQQLQAKGS
jgi:hypothetical protein